MNFNNEVVTAVKFSGRDINGKIQDHGPVGKILNKNKEVIWESVWSVQQVMRVKTGSQLSTTHPGCYYVSGSIMLEKYLPLVAISSSEYATNIIEYVASTGEMRYTVFYNTPLTEIAVVVIYYRFIDVYEYKPTVTWSITSKDVNTSKFTATFTFGNSNKKNSALTIKMYDEFGYQLYSGEAAITSNKTKTLTLTLTAREVRIVLTFHATGFTDSTSVYYLYPF